jgi:prevent-host-death family protein
MNDSSQVKFIISTEAQNNFGRLLDDVSENHTRYVIKRFGHPKAVMISLDDFERLLETEREGHEYLKILRESRPGYVLGETIETSP